MFEQLEQVQARKLSRFALFSLVAHGALVIGIALIAIFNSRPKDEKKPVEVTFLGPGHGQGPPPPPPPLGSKTKHHKQVVHKVEIPKVVEVPKTVVVETPKELPKEEGEEGGVKGGVIGGVKGGVVNGTVGGTGGGGVAPPDPPKAVKPKNVPAFVLARDVLNRPEPRMTEVYKAKHHGEPAITGAYRVCVGLDGHVYDVIPMTSIPGADEAFVEQIKSDWLYKPQKAPACFLYMASVQIQ